MGMNELPSLGILSPGLGEDILHTIRQNKGLAHLSMTTLLPYIHPGMTISIWKIPVMTQAHQLD